jgi:hypothetical protein
MLPSSHLQPPGSDTPEDAAITLRLAVPEDAHVLTELAQLDCAKVPPSPILMAEVGGQMRAAISLRDGSTIADPFQRTAPVRDLLAARAEHLRTDQPTRARRVRRVLVGTLAGA